ncbi:MAG TPA: prolipoprotein diacylglyceryl transferase family protein [Patescibacteria group bacterium]|nr:prolipoprotein diacylglyceryl transferase family protein [Patescibacteria group bacterium]
MWPTLISVGPIAIHSFGILIFLGVFFGGLAVWTKGREEGFEEEAIMDAWLISGLVSLVVGRLGYILTHWPDFGLSWYKMLFVTKFPGLSFESVVMGALLSLSFFAIIKKWSVFKWLEVAVLGITTVMIWGFAASFLAGSNLGIVVNGWWGLPFPGVDGRRLPVQLIWALGLWLGLRLLRKWEQQYRRFSWYQHDKDEARPGFVLGVFLIILGLMRLGLSFVTDVQVWRGPLSLDAWWGLSFAICGVLIILIRSGITIKVPVRESKPKTSVRKKIGFDFK